MRLTKLMILCIIFGVSGCASKIYQDGARYQDKAIDVSYAQIAQIHYAQGIFKELDDEGKSLTSAEYVLGEEEIRINPKQLLYLAFEGSIDNFKNKKLDIYLCYRITVPVGAIIADELLVFSTSIDSRKFVLKCPLSPGTKTNCFIRISTKDQLDLELPGINYSVEGDFSLSESREAINYALKNANN